MAFHCAAVSGTTERRPWRTSGLSAKTGMALMSAEWNRLAPSRPSGFRSTTTSFGFFDLGSG